MSASRAGATLGPGRGEGGSEDKSLLWRHSRHGGRGGCFGLNRAGSDTKQLHWWDWMQLYSVLSCSYNAGFWIALKEYDSQRKDSRSS
jgi:hypothetical protein